MNNEINDEKPKKKTPILFEKKADCCGCTACLNTCPKGAIRMQEDEEGFLYPMIDEEKCINCNLCMKSCPLK